ncbi:MULTISPECIES: cytochrome c peroxidase [unclassified Sinorhizobium]|uniref:cytochrome-c peroxidase n=1 Tax=unclassified Sinorhizobium TaxID=2613772 RepID=UPI0024C33492|nr:MULTISPECIES: cytochrome c peroxidase [unclassified Sinorhizobium]MDK1374750.1 cytochrome c peroxidase [Sinorhizobium sp. 6-70]MDK1479067.1 cytochrome c peroxidase [Sinorhizobium sp. 6-117]
MGRTTGISLVPGNKIGAILLIAAIAWVSIAFAGDGALPKSASGSALSPLPPPASLPPAKVALGERLFHDPMLSGREKLSCSACHNLETGGTVPLPRTIGYDGQVHAFNAPTIFNVGNNYRLGWRGRFTSLAVQNEAVLNDRGLMAANWTMLLSRLTRDQSYLAAFRRLYGAPPSRETVLDALVTFQMSLTTPNAPFDRFLMGDKAALTPVEKDGFRLFIEYGCVSCHQGANIGGNMFQIFGVFGSPDAEGLPKPSDLDKRLQATEGEDSVFRVPSLRNVEVTAPYFHDGSAATLRDAIAVMGRSQLGRELSQSDIANLEAFLKSLTGEYNGKRLLAVVTETAR